MYAAHELFSAIHREGPSSIPGQPMWDLWWTKWYSDRFLFEYLSFSPVNIFRQILILIFIVKLLLSEGKVGENLGPSNKIMPFRVCRSTG